MCTACGENNQVDELEDNSRCGFCGYDMAPLSKSEEEMMQLAVERSEMLREQQEAFDEARPREAAEQFGDELSGVEALPAEVRQPWAAQRASDPQRAKMAALEVAPFTPAPLETAHSRLYRHAKRRPSSDTPLGPPGFDWMCRTSSCGHINPGDEEVCLHCGAHIAPAEWECLACASVNHLSRARCFNCSTPIPVCWTCRECHGTTSIYEGQCRSCTAARPPGTPRSLSELRSAGSSGGGLRAKPNDWHCGACSALNFSRRTECFQCGSPRAGASDSAGSVSDGFNGAGEVSRAETPVSHNNWFCRFCQANNFRTRTSCWQCGQVSKESAGWSASASAPHFAKEGFQEGADSKPTEGHVGTWKKSDDWTCAKCFSKNFRGRGECYKCGAPKKLAVAPRRVSMRKPVKL